MSRREAPPDESQLEFTMTATVIPSLEQFLAGNPMTYPLLYEDAGTATVRLKTGRWGVTYLDIRTTVPVRGTKHRQPITGMAAATSFYEFIASVYGN